MLPALAGLVVFTLGLLDPTVYSDGDPYWHVAVGKWIVAQRTVPTMDVWSFTFPGLAWTAHEWLSEVLMYALHAAGGWQAIQIVASAAFGLTIVILLQFVLERMSLASAVTLVVIGASMMSIHYVVRPHVLVWPITALWMAALVQATETRRPPPWWLIPVLVLWANLHASFTLALGFAGALALEAWSVAEAGPERTRLVRRWALFLTLATLAVLLNPRGLHAFTHAAGVMNMQATLAIVGEWQSANFQRFQYILLWLGLVLALAFTGRLRLSPIRIVFVLGLLYLALKHQRYHALLGLVSPFLLARPLGEGLGTQPQTTVPSARPRRRLAGVAIGIAMAALIATVIRPRMSAAPAAAVTPAAAIAAYQATGAKGNVFNAYELGGYLIYRGIPVFIDGRGDMYGDAFMKEAADASWLRVPHALDSLLVRRRIGWTLLRPDAPAAELLDHLPAWTRLYADSIAVVHVRRDLLAGPVATPASVGR
jgi:hypothetical protein